MLPCLFDVRYVGCSISKRSRNRDHTHVEVGNCRVYSSPGTDHSKAQQRGVHPGRLRRGTCRHPATSPGRRHCRTRQPCGRLRRRASRAAELHSPAPRQPLVDARCGSSLAAARPTARGRESCQLTHADEESYAVLIRAWAMVSSRMPSRFSPGAQPVSASILSMPGLPRTMSPNRPP